MFLNLTVNEPRRLEPPGFVPVNKDLGIKKINISPRWGFMNFLYIFAINISPLTRLVIILLS